MKRICSHRMKLTEIFRPQRKIEEEEVNITKKAMPLCKLLEYLKIKVTPNQYQISNSLK